MAEAAKKTRTALASTELAIGLFIIICIAAIPGTLIENRELVYQNPLFVGLLVVLAVNLIACSVRRFRSISKPVLVLHGGVVVTLAGCVLTSFGYVATVNVYEGSSTGQAYRWDVKADSPLGMEVTVRQIHREYYPIPVKVGVLRGEEKVGLHTVKTGESFALGEYVVRADGMLFPEEVLSLSVLKGGVKVGSCDTAGNAQLPAEFPYAFKLVAFKDPVFRRMWVDLAVAREAERTEGVAEVNHPFVWQGLYFYNTQLARDSAGRAYAGIQIVNDPGRRYVFAGFAITCVGAALCFARRFFRKVSWN